jgi:senataxin
LKPAILNPKDVKADNDYFDIPERLDQKLHERYNPSQYQAIKESLKKEGITLIQGPPGTGKTTTILGILSVLLNSRTDLSLHYQKMIAKSDSITSVDSQVALQRKREQNMLQYRKAMPWIYDDEFIDW